MSTLAVPVPRRERSAASQIALAGAVVAVLDISLVYLLFGVIMKGVTPMALLQSVAEGLLGRASYQGGVRTAALGAVCHVVISYGWTIGFYLAVRGIPALRRMMRTTTGVVIVGLAMGAVVHFAMQLVVLPLSRARPMPFGTRIFWLDLALHMVAVGLPMALIIRDGEPR
jgi:hypothetical protein